MLVLTRKQQEKIQIGDNIFVTVLKTKGKTVQLGIEAPQDVSILRGELAFELPEDTQPRNGAGCEQSQQSTGDCKVGHARVSRDQVGRVLPSLLAGEKPLRQYLETGRASTQHIEAAAS